MNELEHLQEWLLNEYLDGSLEDRQQELVERHLQHCEACGARLDELRQLIAALAAVPERPLERDLSAGVVAAIQRQPRKQILAWSNLAFLVQAAAAGAILAAAWPVLSVAGGGLPGITLNFLAGPYSAVWIELTLFWSTGAQQIVQTAQQMAVQNMDWMRQLFSADQSALAAWSICLGSSFILWLVGNSFLLRSQKSQLNRRNL